MTGFKNFILRGNLVEIAVGLIMALAFAAVVAIPLAFPTDSSRIARPSAYRLWCDAQSPIA